MTTLAIIGSGIAGRSLLYALAKERKKYSRILLFSSDTFARACSLHSTAMVAPRGVTAGHSPLGDLLVNGFQTFKEHVEKDAPEGVFPSPQYTCATTKLDQFKKRYPQAENKMICGELELSQERYIAPEEGYVVDPDLYLKWLLVEAKKELPIEEIQEFVTEFDEEKLLIKTQLHEEYSVDHVVFATGAYSKFWNKVKSNPIQGSYLEFQNCELTLPSFSITLDGDNFVYHAHSKKLLIGSTTSAIGHELTHQNDLKDIYLRVRDALKITLPDMSNGQIKVGLREKAPKREPYLVKEGKVFRVGGFYKNGFSLALHLSRDLANQLLLLGG